MPHSDTSGMSPQAIVLIVFSGIALLLDVPPLIWHLKKRNVAPAALIIWIILLNVMNFVNPFIWPDDDLTSRWEGYGLCDVEVKLQIGSWVGLPGALACIMRMLVGVLDTKSSRLVPTTAQKRRDVAFTTIFCFAIPILLMALHFIVQPNRYAVWAISGCTPTFDGSWLSLVLIYIWPCVISVLDAYYAIFLIIRMHRYRSEFSRLLQESNTTKSRFLRLFFLSMILVIVLFPWEVYILFRNVEYGVTSYSWSLTHGSTWQLIAPVKVQGTVLFDRWLRMCAAYAVFIFFGLGDDAVRMYKTWLSKLGFGRLFQRNNGSSSDDRMTWIDSFKILRFFRKSSIRSADKNNSSNSRSKNLELTKLKSYTSSSTQTDDETPTLTVHHAFSDGRLSITKDVWNEKEDV